MKSTYDLPRYTRCPNCQTTFRVSNEQLKAAGGKVRCGHCTHVFNALFCLVAKVPEETVTSRAEPTLEEAEIVDTGVKAGTSTGNHTEVNMASELAAVESEPPWKVESDLEPESVFETDSEAEAEAQPDWLGALETDLEEPLETGADADVTMEEPCAEDRKEEIEYIELSGGDFALETPFDDDLLDRQVAADGAEKIATLNEADAVHIESEQSESERGETERAEAETFDFVDVEVAADANVGSERIVADSEEHIPFPLRESLLAAEKPPRSKLSLLLWTLVALVLTGVLVTQLSVFRSTQINQQFPALRPLVAHICAFFDCEYSGPRKVDEIRLLNRDIRAIPERDGVLLIIATMVNEAGFAQPYPDFEIVLSDLAGTIVAQRRFVPNEYLGDLGREHPLMEPGIPVQVQLEVLDPGADAVNFEINFF